jgi:alpha-1,6-mannosyltransferase
MVDVSMAQRGSPAGLIVRLLPPALLLEGAWIGLRLAQPILTRPWPFQALVAVAFLCYSCVLVQARHLERVRPLIQALIVLVGALIFQLTLLPAPLAGSDDLYRYVWDGRVSATGIDPYRYPPGDPALAPLRDTAIWHLVNAKMQPSPYPPLLEAAFALIYRLQPDSLLAMKTAMCILNLGVSGLLLMLLQQRRQPLWQALIYAWNPQVTVQVALSGHNDPLLLCWLLLALWLGAVAEPRRRMVGAWALAVATLAKYMPVLALPVLLRRWGWRAAGVYCATLGAVYGALLMRHQVVFAGVITEASTAQFNDALHYLIARLARLVLPAGAAAIASSVGMVGIGVVILVLMRGVDQDMSTPLGTLLATYLLFAVSVAPWYTLWILPFVALEALPRPHCLAHLPATMRMLGSYWVIFSWTASFSELFYYAPRLVWIAAHVLEYGLPLGMMLCIWCWARWPGVLAKACRG